MCWVVRGIDREEPEFTPRRGNIAANCLFISSFYASERQKLKTNGIVSVEGRVESSLVFGVRWTAVVGHGGTLREAAEVSSDQLNTMESSH